MVSPPSRGIRAATPLLLLLLSSTTYAQYTLRGRVVQDNHRHSLGRRAELAPSPAESGGADKSAAGAGDESLPDGENAAGPEASSSTESDKGDEGGDSPSEDEHADGDVNAGGEDKAVPAVSHPFAH